MSCSKCYGADAETHEDWEHSEDWVNLADARYTGDVIFMRSSLIYDALQELNIPDHIDEKVKTHVDRIIVKALIEALMHVDTDKSMIIISALSVLLNDSPVRNLPDEDPNYDEDFD